jgi:hypothetical protein
MNAVVLLPKSRAISAPVRWAANVEHDYAASQNPYGEPPIFNMQ